MLLRILPLAAILLTSTVAAQESGIEVGTKAPSAAVQTLAGKPADLSSYVGKGPVLMEFWATWCPNCKELEPALIAAQKKYARKVRFVGVAVSVNQSPARIRAYVAKHGIRHDILFDASGKAAEAYDVPATSYVVVLNAKGNVVYTGLGGKQDLEAAIKKAL
ncbi:MAG TPA: TlpA disulfide reductase family protein [Gemmatimonadaceae bacterium]|nr:TlpA disulfide reductase family protein [Gemmatimonadaceae bacterium]